MSDPGRDPALKAPPPPPRAPEQLTLHGVLNEACRLHAHQEALVFDDPLAAGATTRWTYEDLQANAEKVAAALLAAGLGKGARVGILLGNRPEAVATIFGTSMAGAVAVPLSTFSTRSELAYLLGHADISLLVTQSRLLAHRFAEDVDALAPEPRPTGGFPYLREVVTVGGATWQEFLETGRSFPPEVVRAAAAAASPADPALVIFTSGTTEHPKGILHSHRATALQFWQQARIFGRGPETRMWTALPVFWTAGFNTAMGATLAAGGCWVMQETFDPPAAIELMERERVTEPYTLPHQTAALEEEPAWPKADFSAMRCVYGKSAFARHPRVNPDPGWMMPVGYGLSETGAFFSAHAFDAPRELRAQSMGRLLPGNELKVLDPETGEPLGASEEGELCVRGPTLMERYLKRSREECFDPDGFFHTGDSGYYDEDGYLHWTGRRTEMIKTAGANVSPAELEVALRACPPVKLARALGVEDQRLGQQVVLCVVLKDGASATEGDIQQFLADRVAAYKVPKRVLFFSEEELPMTASRTKVRDNELRQLVIRRLAPEGSR